MKMKTISTSLCQRHHRHRAMPQVRSIIHQTSPGLRKRDARRKFTEEIHALQLGKRFHGEFVAGGVRTVLNTKDTPHGVKTIRAAITGYN